MPDGDQLAQPRGRRPLDGIRVVELGHALSGPFAGTLLADFGAEVIKIELPGKGDQLRLLGLRKEGVALWWKVAARNKLSVTLDFTTEEGHEMLLGLIDQSDIVIENFRPGVLERHGLSWETLRERNRGLVMLRISGFGQTGTRSREPGFGRIGEAMSGALHLTGESDGAPMHAGYSLVDTVTGLMGAFGVLVALAGRSRSGEGDCVDLALYEPLFRLVDWQVIVNDQLGVVPERAGNSFPEAMQGAAAGVHKSADGTWLSYSAGSDTALSRLAELIHGPEALASGPFATPEGRWENYRDLQQSAGEWIGKRTAAEALEQFRSAGCVMSPVFDIEAIMADVTINERENIVAVEDDDLGTVRMQGVVPRLVEHPGWVDRTGPDLGADTASVLERLLGVTAEEVSRLKAAG
ncbi:MAG: CaiB/BaiF CoA transferase family protein, partial [Acidimicrobiales bacterium]